MSRLPDQTHRQADKPYRCWVVFEDYVQANKALPLRCASAKTKRRWSRQRKAARRDSSVDSAQPFQFVFYSEFLFF